MFAILVPIFLVLALGCFIYVNLKQRYRVDQRGKLWQIITIAQNYTPILLFVTCVGLYMTYYPYAQNFSYYMTAEGVIDSFEGLFYNSLPSYSLPPRPNELELQNPLHGYVPWGLAGVGVAIFAALWSKRPYRPPGK